MSILEIRELLYKDIIKKLNIYLIKDLKNTILKYLVCKQPCRCVHVYCNFEKQENISITNNILITGNINQNLITKYYPNSSFYLNLYLDYTISKYYLKFNKQFESELLKLINGKKYLNKYTELINIQIKELKILGNLNTVKQFMLDIISPIFDSYLIKNLKILF